MITLLAYADLVGGLVTLVGTGAVASAPWIIHLLNKRRYRVIEWAAMEYLLESQRRNRRRIQIEQLILLAIRTLLILLLALALARPFSSAFAAAFFGSAPIDRVVVLDDSYSSTRRMANETVFDEIKKGAAALAGRTEGSQTFGLVHMSEPGSGESEYFLAPMHVKEPEAFAKEHIDIRTPSDAVGRLAEALARARKIASEGKENINKEIYLLTALQETDWRDRVSQARRDDVAKELAAIKEADYKLIIADMTPRDKTTDKVLDADNLAVVELASVDRNLVTDRPAHFRVTVRNFGSTGADRLNVTPVIDGLKLPAIQMSIQATGASSETFEYLFDQPGSHRVAVQIAPDILPLDDMRYLAVNVRPSVNVLIVDGDPKIDRSRTESVYLELALNPDALLPAAERTIKSILPKVVSRDQFPDEDLADYDAVVLANVESLGGAGADTKLVGRLEQFVRSGGGLLIFLGDKVQRDWYDRQLWKDGNGLLPAELDPATGVLDNWKDAKFLDVVARNHPMFRDRAGSAGEKPLGTVPVFRYFPARAATQTRTAVAPAGTRGEPRPTQISAASVLVTYEGTNDPAMVEQGFGAGRVILVTTTCDTDWTIWPRLPSFLIGAQQMVSYVANTVRGEQNVVVGRPFSVCVPPKFYGGKFMYRTPSYPTEPERALAVRTEEDQIWTYSPPAARAGFAALELAKGEELAEKMYLAASPDCTQESNLSPLGEKDLRALYKDELADAYFVTGADALGKMAATEAKTEFWMPLVAIVVAFMLIETFCAWKFAHHMK